MAETVKVVVLGGSAVATPELAAAIINQPNRQRPIELVLVGRSMDKLQTVTGVTRILAENDPLLHVSCTTQPENALEGADFVLNQIRAGGLKARSFDETFPHSFGLPGEETVGPGGFANASRTIPAVLEYARVIEKVCPSATLLTFSNPSSLVHYAINHYTRLNAIGLCDGPVTLSENIAEALNVAVDDLVIDYVGMHHFGWAVGIWANGKDLLPEALSKVALIAPEVEPAIAQAIGAIPGLYFNYFFHPDRMLAKKLGKRPRADELLDLQDELLDEYKVALTTGKKPEGIAKRKARWYRAIIAPVIVSLVEGRTARFVLNVLNGETISWLPKEAIIEVPTILSHGTVRPLAICAVPQDVRAMIQRNCAYEMLAVEAIVEHNRAKALRALLLNPIIHTYEQASQTLELAWKANLELV